MGKLITIEKPKAGDKPKHLWKTVVAIIDALNDVSITVVLSDSTVEAKVSPGDFELTLPVITQNDAINSIPGYAPPGSSEEGDGSSDDSAAPTGATG